MAIPVKQNFEEYLANMEKTSQNIYGKQTTIRWYI